MAVCNRLLVSARLFGSSTRYLKLPRTIKYSGSTSIPAVCRKFEATPLKTTWLPSRCLSTRPDPDSLVYTGPLSNAVRAIKIFSICTAACAVSFSPILIYFGNPATPIVGRIAIASLVTSVGLSTTFILHWFIKSYITKLFYDRSTDNVTAETLTLFGNRRLTSFHVSEARPPDAVSAFSTFQGRGKHFFMHTEIFEDPELLRQLLGSYAMFEDNATKIKPSDQ